MNKNEKRRLTLRFLGKREVGFREPERAKERMKMADSGEKKNRKWKMEEKGEQPDDDDGCRNREEKKEYKEWQPRRMGRKMDRGAR